MKNSDKNKLIALLITLIVIIGTTFVINNSSSDKSISYKSSSDSLEKSNSIKSGKSNDELVAGSKDIETEKKEIVIEDSSSAEAIENSNVGSDIVVDTSASKDEQAIQYFTLAEEKIDNMYENENKLRTEGKALFVKLVDFIYYDTEINGVKFNDLVDSTKNKLISIVNAIDTKIESKLPGYKETVVDFTGKTYTYLSDKLKQGITYIDEKIEEKVTTDVYKDFKEDVGTSVDTFKESFEVVKDVTKDVVTAGKNKIKNWYEGWR